MLIKFFNTFQPKLEEEAIRGGFCQQGAGPNHIAWRKKERRAIKSDVQRMRVSQKGSFWNCGLIPITTTLENSHHPFQTMCSIFAAENYILYSGEILVVASLKQFFITGCLPHLALALLPHTWIVPLCFCNVTCWFSPIIEPCKAWDIGPLKVVMPSSHWILSLPVLHGIQWEKRMTLTPPNPHSMVTLAIAEGET